MFDARCGGDPLETQARIWLAVGWTPGDTPSWTSIDERAAAEGRSMAYIGRLWYATRSSCPTPEAE